MASEVDFEVELEKLKQILASGRETQIDLIQFMQNCTMFFDATESLLREGSSREKEIVFRKVKELGGSVEGDIQGLCKESGKSEEEIAAFLENPDNYPQDSWQAIQRAHCHILKGRQSKDKKKKLS